MEGKASDPTAWPDGVPQRSGRARSDRCRQRPPGACARDGRCTRSSAHDPVRRAAAGFVALHRSCCWPAPPSLSGRPLVTPRALLVKPRCSRRIVTAGKLPPLDKRIPARRWSRGFDETRFTHGKHGGTLHMLIGRAQDVRMLFVYGYAPARALRSQPCARPGHSRKRRPVKDNRIFTLRLRKGHRWVGWRAIPLPRTFAITGRMCCEQSGAEPDGARPAN